MCSEAPFEKLAALPNRFESLAGGIALAIVSPQIAERLFAFKDRGRSNFLGRPSIRSDVGAIPAFWQTHFHCARGIALGLRPQKRESLQSRVSLSFAAGVSYSRSHLASSRAQYVTMILAPALLSAVMISRTASRSFKSPFSTAPLTMAYSPLT